MTDFKVATTAETFWALYHQVRSGEPFVYTRYGDGEMNIMLEDGAGAAGQPANHVLAAEARAVFTSTHPHNMVGLAMHEPEPKMTPELFLGWNDPRYNTFRHERRFENAIALHYYAVFKPHLLRLLFDQIRSKPKLVLSPYLSNPAFAMFLGEHTAVRVPEADAYASINEWYPKLEGHDLIILAVGAAKCEVARRLLHEKRNVQVLDLGSLLDYVVGNPSRSWIAKADPEARKVLLGG